MLTGDTGMQYTSILSIQRGLFLDGYDVLRRKHQLVVCIFGYIEPIIVQFCMHTLSNLLNTIQSYVR